MKNDTLFLQIFRGFILGIILFTSLLLIFYRVGLNSAINKWGESYLEQKLKIGVEIINNPESVNEKDIPQDEPLFVYDINRELIYSNRGLGKFNTNEEDFIPLTLLDKTIGYIYTSKLQFMDDKANKQFTNAITRAIVISLVISIISVVVISFFISRKISRPAKKIASSILSLSNELGKSSLVIDGAYEIRKIAEAVNTLSQNLFREREIRTQWTRDIAHDLRTPTAALKAQFEGMSLGALDINVKRINQNLKELYRMELLVEDISELMKLEEPELKLYLDDIDSDDFFNEIILRDNHELESKKIKVNLNILSKNFTGDEMLIHRAISNIWTNAIRHTDIGGTIDITIKGGNNSHSEITIRNSGDIISEDVQNKIFDRLYRGENSRNSNGSGLGLTIVKKIITLHKGEISVKSSLDIGTEFNIMLPNSDNPL